MERDNKLFKVKVLATGEITDAKRFKDMTPDEKYDSVGCASAWTDEEIFLVPYTKDNPDETAWRYMFDSEVEILDKRRFVVRVRATGEVTEAKRWKDMSYAERSLSTHLPWDTWEDDCIFLVTFDWEYRGLRYMLDSEVEIIKEDKPCGF